MALIQSPKIITDSLLFYYDMLNPIKSWKGRPTTNILPSPEVNGRFTTDNGWGTYNTNQYNSNTYFSIGTISSVSNDIVTTSGNHPLRSYDVVTPQTSGGGLSAGTNYLIKKISNTQFSIHSYNSSQNGSQGYIVSGYHKVHESLATDQKVSINSSSFPTMWWGPPHLPNSGLVKEIVEGAGPYGQNVMRLHIHRTDGVVDGMAYGVYVPVTAGDVINVSYWIRSSYPGKSLGYSTYFGAASAYSNGTVTTATWQRVKFQWTASATFSFYQYWWPDGSTDVPYSIDMCDLQVEVNTGTAGSTPFVAGTRSSTGALLDLTNRSTITTNNLTYNSDDTFNFAGGDATSTLSIPLSTAFNKLAGTISMWVNPAEYSGSNGLFVNRDVNTANAVDWLWIGSWSSGQPFYFRLGDGSTCCNNDLTLSDWPTYCPLNTWTYVTCSWETGKTSKIYTNGMLRTSRSISTIPPTNPSSTGRIGLGHESPGSWNGKIGVVQIYGRQLTDLEVYQSFSALRGRYNV